MIPNLLIFFSFTLFPIFLFSFETKFEKNQLEEANLAFSKGLEESSLKERTNNFNKSLSIYKSLDIQFPYRTSSQLDGAMGDSYYQLEEYPLAILHYYRGLKKEPDNSLIQSHLKEAQKKLGLSDKLNESKIERFFSFNYKLLKSSQFELFFSCILIVLLLFSLYIWYRNKKIKFMGTLLGIFTSILFINLILFYYLTPISGIIIESTGLYRLPSFSASQLDYMPLLKGSKIDVIKSENEGNWLKIYDSNGTLGYVPTSKVRII